MKITIRQTSDLKKTETDVLIAGVFTSNKASDDESLRELPENLISLDQAFNGQLLKTLSRQGFHGKEGETFTMHTLSLITPKTIVLIGLGDREKRKTDTYRRLGGFAYGAANDLHATSASIVYPIGNEPFKDTQLKAMFEGIRLASYHFDKFVTEHKCKKSITSVEIVCASSLPESSAKQIEESQTICDSVCLARDLVNEGPADLTPPVLANRAREAASSTGLEVTIFEEDALQKERMNMMLAVGRAARDTAPARMVRLAYRPSSTAKTHIVLVGKGLTFDSGGLSIKPATGMVDMKTDMSGAATVLGTMLAIAKLKPDIAVTGYMGCAENGVGSRAYHPGDILVSRKGLSVEINNTDAEGRLVLADVMDYAQERDKPDVLIDIATLTGACIVALGPYTAGIFCNDETLQKQIRESGQEAGEDFWPLPLNEELYDMLKSNVADMVNSGERYGGSITAALFLKKFVKKNVKWAHLDIAGPATHNKAHPYLKKGGVGFGIRTLIELITRMAN